MGDELLTAAEKAIPKLLEAAKALLAAAKRAEQAEAELAQQKIVISNYRQLVDERGETITALATERDALRAALAIRTEALLRIAFDNRVSAVSSDTRHSLFHIAYFALGGRMENGRLLDPSREDVEKRALDAARGEKGDG